MTLPLIEAFCGGSDGKESTSNSGDLGLIAGLGRAPGEGNGYLLQYSCLENSMDRGVWCAIVRGSQRVRHNWATNSRTPGLLWWLGGKESTCQCRRLRFDPWVGKIHCSRKRQPTAVFLAWKIPWTDEPGRLSSMESQSQTWLSTSMKLLLP